MTSFTAGENQKVKLAMEEHVDAFKDSCIALNIQYGDARREEVQTAQAEFAASAVRLPRPAPSREPLEAIAGEAPKLCPELPRLFIFVRQAPSFSKKFVALLNTSCIFHCVVVGFDRLHVEAERNYTIMTNPMGTKGWCAWHGSTKNGDH